MLMDSVRFMLRLLLYIIVSYSLVLYAVFIERYILKVRRRVLEFENLPPAFDGFTLLELSDLHYGFLTPKWWLRRVIRKANSLQKDAVVTTGDYVRKPNCTREIDGIWPILMELEAPGGVFMVLGNHDHWASTPLSLRKLEASGRSVRHRASCIKRGNDSIVIAGAGDFWCDTPGIDEALDGIPENAFRIVIAHNPDTADGIHRSRVDLYVSGHTHGGQVKIPCTDNTFLIPVRNKKYDAGLKKNRKNEIIYISKGVGWSVQPLRINCFPEITLIELRKIRSGIQAQEY